MFGKERRKVKPSAEGKLGVEGMEAEILREAFRKAGVLTEEKNLSEPITKTDLYLAGFSGISNSTERRRAFQKKLGLPANLSASALLDVLNSMMSREEFLQKTELLKEDDISCN